MRSKQFDVDDSQPRSSERTCCREQGVVLEVFVVDRVELPLAYQLQRMVYLDAQPAFVGEQSRAGLG